MHPGIQYRQQSAHTCRNGNLIRLTLGRQALDIYSYEVFEGIKKVGSDHPPYLA